MIFNEPLNDVMGSDCSIRFWSFSGRRYGSIRETEGSRIRRIKRRTTVRMMCSYVMCVCRTSVSAQFRIRLVLECLFIRLQIP